MQPNTRIQHPRARQLRERAARSDPEARPRALASGIYLVMLFVGLFPWFGLLVVGTWDQGELAVALLLCIGAVWGMVRERRPPRDG